LGRIPGPKPNFPHGGLIGPSPIPSWRDPDGQPPPLGPGLYPAIGERHVTTRELTIEEIEEIIEDYEYSCKIIALADIDAIEIHAHMGYLLDEFMTSLWNKRSDRYGGDLEGRVRFAVELVQAVKRGAGEDFPTLFKYPLTHYLEGGREIEEGLEIAKRLEAAGLDALTINSGTVETYDRAQPPSTGPRGCAVDLAEMTKKAVSIPVIAVGKLSYPDLAESVLQEGKADFISLARQFLADPEWPNKVKEGRIEDIRPCIYCHEGCVGRVRKYKYISCAVNPATGVEKDLAITPAEKKKSVLVIGGGPAGMEAARVAALRGHSVTLWEKDATLGGQLISAAVPNFKSDYKLLLDHLQAQVRKTGVTLELQKCATPQSIQSLNPDVVFVATGATTSIPKIEGIEEGIKNGKVIAAVDLLLGNGKAGKSVAVVGGGAIGCETALFLAEQGKEVTVVKGRPIETLQDDMNWINALHLLKLLDEKNVKILDRHRTLRITETGVQVANNEGKESSLIAESIVVALGMKSVNGDFEEALKDKVPEIIAIGDCIKPRRVMNAIWEGYRKARIV
jgi:2-enoate reductase